PPGVRLVVEDQQVLRLCPEGEPVLPGGVGRVAAGPAGSGHEEIAPLAPVEAHLLLAVVGAVLGLVRARHGGGYAGHERLLVGGTVVVPRPGDGASDENGRMPTTGPQFASAGGWPAKNEGCPRRPDRRGST